MEAAGDEADEIAYLKQQRSRLRERLQSRRITRPNPAAASAGHLAENHPQYHSHDYGYRDETPGPGSDSYQDSNKRLKPPGSGERGKAAGKADNAGGVDAGGRKDGVDAGSNLAPGSGKGSASAAILYERGSQGGAGQTRGTESPTEGAPSPAGTGKGSGAVGQALSTVKAMLAAYLLSPGSSFPLDSTGLHRRVTREAAPAERAALAALGGEAGGGGVGAVESALRALAGGAHAAVEIEEFDVNGVARLMVLEIDRPLLSRELKGGGGSRGEGPGPGQQGPPGRHSQDMYPPPGAGDLAGFPLAQPPPGGPRQGGYLDPGGGGGAFSHAYRPPLRDPRQLPVGIRPGYDHASGSLPAGAARGLSPLGGSLGRGPRSLGGGDERTGGGALAEKRKGGGEQEEEEPGGLEALLSRKSYKEAQQTKTGEELLQLLQRPTAKETAVAAKGSGAVGQALSTVKAMLAAYLLSPGSSFPLDSTGLHRRVTREAAPAERAALAALGGEAGGGGVGAVESALRALAGGAHAAVEIEEFDVNGVARLMFKTKGGSALREYCPRLTKDDCRMLRRSSSACLKVHFRRIIAPHTDVNLGDCSFLDTCRNMKTCKYVHYELDPSQDLPPQLMMGGGGAAGGGGGGGPFPSPWGAVGRPQRAEYCSDAELGEAQWINCDIRKFRMDVLGQFGVIMADPPWDIHMELPYGTMADDEMRSLNVPLWGYKRVEELIWVKTNQLQRIIRTGRTGHWLNHSKEHCLVGLKGSPLVNRNMDTDVLVGEVRETSRKPDERISPRTRKLELFARPHNTHAGWISLGNQLNGVRLVDPEVRARFKGAYPSVEIEPPDAPAESQQADEAQRAKGTPVLNGS
eukprot:jgi/Mesen1/10854/ME000093S10374